MIHAAVVIPALGPEESLIPYVASLRTAGIPLRFPGKAPLKTEQPQLAAALRAALNELNRRYNTPAGRR